jgi:DNA-binding CsgD family transcriptional regulator
LPPTSASVARAIAVLGDGAALHAVAKLAGVDEQRAAEATRALANAEILSPSPPLAFVHPLVRDAIYRELSPGELELEHARAAAILRDGGAPTEQVAAQLLSTSPRGERWAAELLRQAGRAAMQTGAPDSAVAYLRRSLDELPQEADRGRLLFELGAAEALTSGPAAAEHLALAYEALEDHQSRAVAAAMLGPTLMFMGSEEEAAAVAMRASRELPPDLADLRMQLEAFEFTTAWFGAGDPGRLPRLRDYRRTPGASLGAKMLAAVAAWEWLCTDGAADECAALAREALADGQLIAADDTLISFYPIVALVLTDRPEAIDVWESALADAHRRGSLFSVSSIHLFHGFSLLRRGELADAEASLRAAHDEFRVWGFAHAAGIHVGSFLAEALLERGRLTEAATVFERAGKADPGRNSTGWWLRTRAALLIAQGRGEEAAAVADELARHCAKLPDPARLLWRSLKAEALDRAGRTEEAVALAREELAVTRHFGAPSALGRTLRVLGTLERDEGLGTLREAVEVLEGSPARLEHAKALAALGSALRRARKPTEAREPLQMALELAGVCGADGLAEHARSELYAAGARPRRDALSGVDSLTPSERRVVDLAAAGRTNRDIAQELYVTPKTVEVHLSNAYRKLGISSRRELAQALAA